MNPQGVTTATMPPSPMSVFDQASADGHEQVVYCQDPDSGLRVIIAIWSTALGPSLGGTRFYPYADEADALCDVLRLSRAMGYKAAAAGLDLGGGKAVIIGDPRLTKSEPLLRAYGRFVDSLGGRYITAEDVGTTQADMDVVARETPYVTGGSESRGGSGDPSPVTAIGVLSAMRAAAEARWGSSRLAGRHVAVQGVGKVGFALARLLHEEGARITVADVDGAAVERSVVELGAEAVAVEKIHAVEADVFAPCALGGAINGQTLPELRCQIVCGSANNQIQGEGIDVRLAQAGILVVPDFVANAGGIINIAEELDGYDRDRALARVAQIGGTVSHVFELAEEEGTTPDAAARRLAESRIQSVSRVGHIRAGRLEMRRAR